MSNKNPTKRTMNRTHPTNSKRAPLFPTGTPSAQLTATVNVVTAEIDQALLDKATNKIQKAVEDAVEAGGREGVKKVLAKLGMTELVIGNLDATTTPARRGAKKRNVSGYMSDKLEEHELQLTSSGSSKTLHKASPRQRGTLESDLRKVFDDLRSNPKSRNEDIVQRTRLDARTVSQAVRYLRGYNLRGELVREPVIFLPEGDRKRYTTYSVNEGAEFPAPSATKAPERKPPAQKRTRANLAAVPERLIDPEELSNG